MVVCMAFSLLALSMQQRSRGGEAKGVYRQPLQYALSDPSGPHRADDLVLNVVCTASRVPCSRSTGTVYLLDIYLDDSLA